MGFLVCPYRLLDMSACGSMWPSWCVYMGFLACLHGFSHKSVCDSWKVYMVFLEGLHGFLCGSMYVGHGLPSESTWASWGILMEFLAHLCGLPV